MSEFFHITANGCSKTIGYTNLPVTSQISFTEEDPKRWAAAKIPDSVTSTPLITLPEYFQSHSEDDIYWLQVKL